jgi:hypothetical protein
MIKIIKIKNNKIMKKLCKPYGCLCLVLFKDYLQILERIFKPKACNYYLN